MKCKYILSIFVLLLSFQTLVVKATTLSISTYIQTLHSSHPHLSEINAQANTQIAQAKEYLGTYDLFVSVSNTVQHGLNSSFSSDFNADGRLLSSTSTLSKKAKKYGTLYSLSGTYSQTQNYPEFLGMSLDDSYETAITLSFSQPLLKNAKGKIDTLSLTNMNHQIELATLQKDENTEVFYTNMLYDYVTWIYHQSLTSLYKDEVKKSKDQLVLIQKMHTNHLVEKQDVLMAEQQVLLAETSYITQQTQLDTQTKKIQLNLQENSDLFPSELSLQELSFYKITKEKISPTPDIHNTRHIKTTDLALSIQKNLLSVAKENKRQALTLTAGTTIGSYQTSLGTMLEDIGDNNEFFTSISTEFPVQKTAENESIQRYQAALDQTASHQDVLLLSLEDALQYNKKTLQMLSKSIEDSNKIIQLSEQIERLESAAYQRAERSSLITVIDAQRQLLKHHIKKTSQWYKLQSQSIAYLELTDSLSLWIEETLP